MKIKGKITVEQATKVKECVFGIIILAWFYFLIADISTAINFFELLKVLMVKGIILFLIYLFYETIKIRECEEEVEENI